MQNKYEILTPDGWSDFHGVRKQTAVGVIKITLENGDELECSLDHKLEVGHGFKEAIKLKLGDEINTESGWYKISSIIKDDLETVSVYDALHVEKNNRYYTNNMVSHNCEFIGSSGTLISGEKLKALTYDKPIYESEFVKQYEKPQKDHVYVMTVDVSRGKGLDYSTFSVFDASQTPCKQVCTFRDNLIGAADYASIIYRIATLYNNAQVLVEINDIGGQVVDTLFFDYGYEDIIYTANNGRNGKQISGGFSKGTERGIRTTKTVKATGCSILKMMIEQDQLMLTDYDTVQELYTFSRKANSYEAESGKHDDMVMNLVLFAWLTDQTFFKDLTDINMLSRLREKTEEEIEENLMPFGFINDGMDDDFGGDFGDGVETYRIGNW